MAKWHRFRDLGDHTPDARAMHSAYELALLYCDDGRWDDAARCLDYGSEIPAPGHFRHEAVLALAGRARIAAHRGELDDGGRLARQAVQLAEQSDMLTVRARVWCALGEVLRPAGDTAGADAAEAEALRLYELKGNVTAAASLRGAAR